MSETFKVQVNYKSGISMVFKCEYFAVTATGYKWRNADPHPLKLGAEDVESVWQL